jgi:hypothetical protein
MTAKDAVLSPVQMDRIRALSDTELYPEAVRFVAHQSRLPKPSQMAGLVQFGQDWADWNKFVKHQCDRKTHEDGEFYAALNKWNQDFQKRLKEWKLSTVTEGPDAKKIMEHLCNLLIGEFAQHLAAECGYQRVLRKEQHA